LTVGERRTGFCHQFLVGVAFADTSRSATGHPALAGAAVDFDLALGYRRWVATHLTPGSTAPPHRLEA
jgi:hypothetical protein